MLNVGTLLNAAAALGLVRAQPQPEDYPDAPNVTPPPRQAIVGTVEQAMTLESMWRAVQVLQTAGSQLTIDAWRGGQPIDRPSILARPNLDSSSSAFLAETIGSLAQRGNAYWLHDLGANRDTVNLTVLPPLEVAVARRSPRKPSTYSWQGRDYTAREVTHLQLMRVPGRATGLGPIQAWSAGIAGAVRVRTAADTWFDTAGVPNGILTTDMPLTADEAKAYKEQWMGSVRSDEPAVLGRGLKYEYLALKPSEIQWLESRQLTPTEVARLMGIPASLMLTGVKGSSLTYSNLEMDTLQFIRWTLMAYLREIEEAFTRILPRGQQARFNLDAILRADTKTRYEAYSVALAGKPFLDVDEVRATEGLAPRTIEHQEQPA